MSAIAIIPARGGSKRLPRKNILPLAGRPIIAYAIENALASKLFSHVIVSTDNTEIAEIAKNYGAMVLMRPDHLATDDAHELDACLHVLDALLGEGVSPESFCVIYPTAAFLSTGDLQDSYKMLDDSPSADVVMGVASYPIHPYKALVHGDGGGFLKMMYPVEGKQRSQFYPEVVASSGTFYWLRTESFRALRTYYPAKLRGYILPPERALDIDTADDFIFAEKMMAVKG